MRPATLFFALACLGPTLASAQVVFLPSVRDGYINLRTSSTLKIVVDGTDMRAGMNYHNEGYWGNAMVGVREYAQFRLDEYSNKVSVAPTTLVRQVVADSRDLWVYSLPRNEYSATRYGSFSGKQPEGYRDKVLTSISSVANGPSSYIGRLLKEIYGGKESYFSEWLPGATRTTITDPTAPPTKDPVVPGWEYQATDSKFFYLFGYGPTGSKRSVAFEMQLVPNELDPAKTPFWAVTAVYMGDNTRVGLQSWTIKLEPFVATTAAQFTFVTPASARGITTSGGQ